MSDDFLTSRAWLELRYQVLKGHKGCCEACGASSSKLNPIQVDHIKPRSKHPELALVYSNLQVLCRNCNLGKGASDQTDWRSGRVTGIKTLEHADPQTRARFQQLTWLRMKGETLQIRREAERQMYNLMRELV